MTVKELREKLASLDDKMHVVISRETESEVELYEINDVSPHTGTPHRADASGHAGFTFEKSPVTWLFIDVERA